MWSDSRAHPQLLHDRRAVASKVEEMGFTVAAQVPALETACAAFRYVRSIQDLARTMQQRVFAGSAFTALRLAAQAIQYGNTMPR